MMISFGFSREKQGSTGVSREKPQGGAAFFHLFFSAKQKKKPHPPGAFRKLLPNNFFMNSRYFKDTILQKKRSAYCSIHSKSLLEILRSLIRVRGYLKHT